MSRKNSRRTFLKTMGAAGSCLLAASRKATARAGGDGPGPVEFRPMPVQQVTTGPMAHFFGYYDKCPWNATGRYLLVHQADFCDRQPVPGEKLRIGRIDRADGDRLEIMDETAAWSWQQGAMLQWLGSSPERELIYNVYDEKDKEYRARIRDLESDAVRELARPIYALSPDGAQAASLPFDRLNRLRPGYGYMARPERGAEHKAPADDGLWTLNVATGEEQLAVPIARAAANKPDDRFKGAEHWFNHAVFSPSGSWITFLHRWKPPGAGSWYTRMYVVRPDGTDLRLIWDNGMISHFDWRDDRTLLAWVKADDGRNCFAIRDIETMETEVVDPEVFSRDGHCSYSPDRRWILNDTYPDEERQQTLMLVRASDGRRIDVGRFLEPREFTGPYRCDLHPRFNREGTAACIDSTHQGMMRQLYVVDVAEITQGT